MRDLVNHVVGEDLWTGPLRAAAARSRRWATGSTATCWVTTPWRGARAAADEAARRGRETGCPCGGTVHLSYGEEQLDEYVYQLAADHLVHGWDLAVATRRRRRPRSRARGCRCAGWYAEREELYRSAGAVGARPANSGGDALSRLIAAFGRDPGWAASR